MAFDNFRSNLEQTTHLFKRLAIQTSDLCQK